MPQQTATTAAAAMNPDELSQTSRSFDDSSAAVIARSPLDARARANTAPADMVEPTTPSAASVEDEEVQQAKAMALAYSSNPHLSVDQAQRMGKNFAKLKKSFRFDKARAIIKNKMAFDGDHGPFRQRSITPRSPPLSPAGVATTPGGGGDQSHHSQVGETENEIREVASKPPPVMPSVGSPSASMLASSMMSSTPTNMIRLTGLAWKRRGGMGKYSSTSAWERRRIELRGRKLMYYKKESEEGDDEAWSTREDIYDFHGRCCSR